MWPLMFAGAGMQYASGLDQGNATKLANNQYEQVQNNLGANNAANVQGYNTQLAGLNGQWKQNVGQYINAAPQLDAFQNGQSKSMGDQQGAVAQAQQMGAGYGGMTYDKGNSSNANLIRQDQGYSQGLLKNSEASNALQNGMGAQQLGRGQAGMTFGAQEGTLGRTMSMDQQQLADLQALYGLQSNQNYDNGQQNMRAAAGVGRTGMEIGQGLGMAGMAYGSSQKTGGLGSLVGMAPTNGSPQDPSMQQDSGSFLQYNQPSQ